MIALGSFVVGPLEGSAVVGLLLGGFVMPIQASYPPFQTYSRGTYSAVQHSSNVAYKLGIGLSSIHLPSQSARHVKLVRI